MKCAFASLIGTLQKLLLLLCWISSTNKVPKKRSEYDVAFVVAYSTQGENLYMTWKGFIPHLTKSDRTFLVTLNATLVSSHIPTSYLGGKIMHLLYQ